MSAEIVGLRQELAALRREVRRQRSGQRRLLLAVAVIACLAAGAPLAAVAANPFNDLNPGSVHNANIDAIYNAHVTTGCVPNVSYCPNANVTREEMASFLARLGGLGGNAPVVNAATLNGWPANALVRTNLGSSGAATYTLTGAAQVLAVTGVTVPAPGIVLVSGAVSCYGQGTGDVVVSARVRYVDGGVASAPLFAEIGNLSGTAFNQALSPVWSFQVATGVRTFVIEALNYAGLGTTHCINAAISVLYEPFGPGGLQAAEGFPSLPAEPWPAHP